MCELALRLHEKVLFYPIHPQIAKEKCCLKVPRIHLLENGALVE
jgi:hypothetical protein